jgi:hypothetical protein
LIAYATGADPRDGGSLEKHVERAVAAWRKEARFLPAALQALAGKSLSSTDPHLIDLEWSMIVESARCFGQHARRA